MNPRVSIAVLLPLVGILACQKPPSKPVEMTRVVIDSLYTISLPENLKPSYDLHDYAELQYYDEKAEMNIVALEDNKETIYEFKPRSLKLESYFDFVENTAFEPADTMNRIMKHYPEHPNLTCIVADYFAVVHHWENPIELYFRIAIYESQNHFFQVVICMPFETYCERLPVIDAITNSFEVLEEKDVSHDPTLARQE